MTDTQEFVVPKSIPITFLIFIAFLFVNIFRLFFDKTHFTIDMPKPFSKKK